MALGHVIAAGQRVEPAAVHSSTRPHQQEDGGEGCVEETPLCRRPGPGGEWQTGATGDTGGVEWAVCQTRAESQRREDGGAAHRPPEGRAGHRAGGEETDSGRQFRVPRRGSVRRREDGEREVRRRVQAGANAWRAVEGVMADRRISKRLKGKVMSTCVTPACLYGTETLALTELQQQRLQVCENNWVRKIARVTRADRRRMVELREETGVQRSLTERLVRSGLQWAGHVERMADDRLPKRAAELREQGRRRRGRPRLRWEDCVKRDVRKAGEEEDWKKKTRDRGGWKRLSDQ